MKTTELNALLRARFSAPEWAILFEVADATGSRHSRWADAVAMSLWPSRGLTLHGIECKVSRSDWLRELKKPEKAEPVFKFMDFWWLAAAPGVVKSDELPTTWGLLEARGEKLVQVVAAPKLEPKAVDRTFLAALLRRASEAEHAAVVKPSEKQLADEFSKGHEIGRASAEKFWKGETDKIAASVRLFEEASGVSLSLHDTWNHKNKTLGEAVKRVLAGDKVTADLKSLRDRARRVADELDAALGEHHDKSAVTCVPCGKKVGAMTTCREMPT